MKTGVIIWIVVVLIVVVVIGIYFQTLSISECERLSKSFDKEAADDSLFPESRGDSFVGGTLIRVEPQGLGYSPAEDLEAYFLYFKGINKEARLILTTTEGNSLPYEVGNFYRFNLDDTRRSGAHGGEFIDRELHKLTLLLCE